MVKGVQRSTNRVLEAVDWSKEGEQKQGAGSAWNTLAAHISGSNIRRR